MHIDSHRASRRHATAQDLDRLLNFIAIRWADLTRSNYSLLDLAIDPKWPLTHQRDKWRVYVKGEDPKEIEDRLRAMNPKGDMDQIEVVELPDNAVSLPRQGALYLPYPYVVPGGRFQEMYAWDSFFIFLGLLQDGKTRLAQNMVDNAIYMVEHYGAVLNGNRSYYTTRSQLPFLGEMVLRMYALNQDRPWLARALLACVKYHAYYTSGGHSIPSCGLQRFFDFGKPGSAPPEADMHEKDKDGKTPHDRVKAFYRAHYKTGIVDYDIAEMYDYEKDELTARYFDSDRAMRESGFDTSCRFGPFGANCLSYLPVCLNSLLYALESNIATIYALVDPSNSAREQYHWNTLAQRRRAEIFMYNWDERDGVFYDYDHVKEERRRYTFGTTFLPLWVGLATDDQARRVKEVALEKLSYPGGLSTSDVAMDTQWDLPYGWAPLQYFAVEGLRRYGYKREADRIAINWSSMMLDCYLRTGELHEKYDVLRRSEKVLLKFGYDTNETGFGWSNFAFTNFVNGLDKAGRAQVLRLDGIGAHEDVA